MRIQDAPLKLKPLSPRTIWGAEIAVARIEPHVPHVNFEIQGYLKQAYIALVTATISVIMLSLSGASGHAEQGPFADLSGSWSGGGNITLSSGSREHIQCRANYAARGGGNDLQLALRCASDTYNFDFRGNAIYSGGTVSGNWSEATQDASGQFNGRVNGNHIGARVEGASFTASLDMTTQGNRQSISLRSPGSEFSDVTIALRRR
jgi:hypothetical protein